MAEAVGHAVLACDGVARDPSGKITLYGLFDRISAPKFPAVHPLFSIYWRCFVPGPGRAGVTIVKPDGSVLTQLEPTESGNEKPHALQGTYTIGGLEFPAEGDYLLVLNFNDKELLKSFIVLTSRPTP